MAMIQHTYTGMLYTLLLLSMAENSQSTAVESETEVNVSGMQLKQLYYEPNTYEYTTAHISSLLFRPT